MLIVRQLPISVESLRDSDARWRFRSSSRTRSSARIEHQLAELVAAGSNPAVRTKNPEIQSRVFCLRNTRFCLRAQTDTCAKKAPVAYLLHADDPADTGEAKKERPAQLDQ